MKLDEEKIDELTKKEEYERIKAQLKAKRVEEERKIAEEKRSLLKIKILESRPALFFYLDLDQDVSQEKEPGAEGERSRRARSHWERVRQGPQAHMAGGHLGDWEDCYYDCGHDVYAGFSKFC